jgi:hypothetical protein
MNKEKILLAGMFISFFICFLEWGNNSAFIFQAAYIVVTNSGDAADNFRHPLIILPFIGDLCFLIGLFQKHPNKLFPITGIFLNGLLVAFILLAGLLSLNYKIILSTIPFITFCFMYLLSLKRRTV